MGSGERNNPFNAWKRDEGVSKNHLYDRAGRQINEGDVVHMIGRLDIMWRVQKVTPVLAPNLPPGMVEVSLVAVVVQGVAGGQPIGDLIKVVDASETKGPAPTAVAGVQES